MIFFTTVAVCSFWLSHKAWRESERGGDYGAAASAVFAFFFTVVAAVSSVLAVFGAATVYLAL
jgi:hypothetical protein